MLVRELVVTNFEYPMDIIHTIGPKEIDNKFLVKTTSIKLSPCLEAISEDDRGRVAYMLVRELGGG